MARRAAILLLSLLPASARADGPVVPVLRQAPLVATVTVRNEFPEYEFFLVAWDGDGAVRRLPLTPSRPARLTQEDMPAAYRVWTVVAVPRGRLDGFGDAVPPCSWFVDQKGSTVPVMEYDRDGALSVATIDFGAYDLPFYDSRERVEVTYRLMYTTIGGLRLLKVSENAGDPWVARGRLAAGALVLVALFGSVLWWGRRRRRRSPPRT